MAPELPRNRRPRRPDKALVRGGLVGIGLVGLATLALAAAAALIALVVALLN